MSRRQFDDYDAQEWREEHERADKERRKREAKKQRHHLDDDDPAPAGNIERQGGGKPAHKSHHSPPGNKLSTHVSPSQSCLLTPIQVSPHCA